MLNFSLRIDNTSQSAGGGPASVTAAPYQRSIVTGPEAFVSFDPFANSEAPIAKTNEATASLVTFIKVLLFYL